MATAAMPASVCIVGAGPSGLVAAKTLLHNAPPGTFRVSVFDSKDHIGGLWPTSKTDNSRPVHPQMMANQSRHTMQFSDLAWDPQAPQIPRAWMVGRYLERYVERYLKSHPDFHLHLATRVLRAEPLGLCGAPWNVDLVSPAGASTQQFDFLLVASGYFGNPIIPTGLLERWVTVPVIHSSQYRDLESLIGGLQPRQGRKILVIGGQVSGVELAGTIASQLSSAAASPDGTKIPDIDQYSVHHVVQQRPWVMPAFTTPGPETTAAPFLPADFMPYSRHSRPLPLTNTQGHIPLDQARRMHAILEKNLGCDQSAFSPLLRLDVKAKTEPPYLACSDWYCDFVRSGMIAISVGRFGTLEGNTAHLCPGEEVVDGIAAVVAATGFDPSPSLNFLSAAILAKLGHVPGHPKLCVSLAFHGTHHPAVPGLGFVGFYSSPYWGIMQMQARLLTELWSKPDAPPAPLVRKLAADDSIRRTLDLRDDPMVSQYPMGDYPWLMQEFAEALSIEPVPLFFEKVPQLSRNQPPLDMLTPARYPYPTDDSQAREEAACSTQDTLNVAIASFTTPKFVARAVFRSLLGTWKLERKVTSRRPPYPSGHFSGWARFLLREKTWDGIQCVGGEDDDPCMEYLYMEEGEFRSDTGLQLRATRQYVWRYDERKDVLSVWFVQVDDKKRADHLFHEIVFRQPDGGRNNGWSAFAGHLCSDDHYKAEYNFAFGGVNLKEWDVEHVVDGPTKDYTIRGVFRRQMGPAECFDRPAVP